MKTLVGLYDTREGARETIEDLVDTAYSREQISMATQHTRRGASDTEPDHEPGDGDGNVLSGLSNLLIGLGTLAVPGLGIIAAAGPLAGLLTGALAGGVAGGLVVGLIGLGIPREQAEAYTEGIRRGGTLVVAQIEDEGLEEAQRIMERRTPIDIEQRSQDSQDIEQDVVHAPVSARTVEGNEDEVKSYQISEPVAEQVLVRNGFMDLDRDLEKRDFGIVEDGPELIELREIEEEIVVETVPRGYEAESEDPVFYGHEVAFRQHHSRTLMDNGHDFAFYRAAYIFGCRLGGRENGPEHGWRHVEAEARRRWAEVNPDGSWVEVSDAIHEAYDQCQLDAQ